MICKIFSYKIYKSYIQATHRTKSMIYLQMQTLIFIQIPKVRNICNCWLANPKNIWANIKPNYTASKMQA